MAAKNARVACPVGVWTKLNDSDTATDISLMLANNVGVSLQATITAAATPTDATGPLELLSYGDGWSEATIAEKFPGVANAVGIYAKPRENQSGGHGSQDAVVSISHAAA